MDGIAATRELARLADVLVLTTYDQDEYVYDALRAGAAGFLLKNTDAAALIDAVRTVARGEGLLAPEVTRRVITAFAGPRTAPPRLSDLTDREREVLRQLGLGHSNQQISAELGTTAATTKTHVSRILTKLGVRSRVQAAIVAREAGLDGRPGPQGHRGGGATGSIPSAVNSSAMLRGQSMSARICWRSTTARANAPCG